MNEHQALKTPVVPVIMMITGLERLIGNLWVSALLGTGIYVVAVWMEQHFGDT